MAESETEPRSFAQMEQDRLDNEARRLDLVERELNMRQEFLEREFAAKERVEDEKNATYARDVDSAIAHRASLQNIGLSLVSAINQLAYSLGGK